MVPDLSPLVYPVMAFLFAAIAFIICLIVWCFIPLGAWFPISIAIGACVGWVVGGGFANDN